MTERADQTAEPSEPSEQREGSFPGYPHLRRVIEHPKYGRMELMEVSRTWDGYLVGMAKIGEKDSADAYMHGVFLGRDPSSS